MELILTEIRSGKGVKDVIKNRKGQRGQCRCVKGIIKGFERQVKELVMMNGEYGTKEAAGRVGNDEGDLKGKRMGRRRQLKGLAMMKGI